MAMVRIPLQLLNLHDDGFHLLVETVVFGHVFKAVLDTGASRTVFDKATVAQYLSHESQLLDTDLKSTGLGTNTMESFSLLVPELRLGVADQWKIRNFEVAVLDLSTINYAYQQMGMEPVIGVIGGDILARYGAVIDYRRMTLQLRQRKMKVQ